jgi:hypothetical protein|tara:strand:+ start:294 stop:4394 length:4101 start_codon:yes stop_codon:yes gene_type:complete
MIIENEFPNLEEKEKKEYNSDWLFEGITTEPIKEEEEVTEEITEEVTDGIYNSDWLFEDITAAPTEKKEKEPSSSDYLFETPVSTSVPTSISTSQFKKYSQTEQEARPEFQRRWHELALAIGEDDQFFEWMRDADWNLGSAAFRAVESGKWDQKTKDNYLWLKDAYDNTELKGAEEWFGAFKNIGWDVITDPANALALLFAIPTGGTSTVIRGTAKLAAEKALKKYTLANIGEATLSSTAKKTAMIEGMKKPAIFGATEGALWTGAFDYLAQSTDINVNPIKENIDWNSIGGSAAIGATFGGSLGAFLGGFSGRKFLQKEFDYFNEEAIYQDSLKTSRKKKKVETKTEDIIEDLSRDVEIPKQKGLERFLSATIGKSTTAFLNLSKSSVKLQEYLSLIRYDYDFTLGGKKRRGEKAASFDEIDSRRTGSYLNRLERSLGEIKRKGFLAALNTRENTQLQELLINPKIKKVNGEAVTPEVRQAAREIKPLLKDIFEEGKREGLFTEFQEVVNYLPRRFKWDLIEKNRGALENLIIKYGLAKPLRDYPKVKGVSATGKEIDVVLSDAQMIDVDAFGYDVAKKWLDLEPADIAKGERYKAEAIVDNMLEYRWTPFEIRGAGKSGDSYGFMKHRPFDVIPDKELLPFLEGNVEKVLQDYVVNASRAITRSQLFGRSPQDFYNNFLKPIREELEAANMPTAELKTVMDQLENMHKKVTGIDSQVIQNKKLRHASEWGKLSQQMAHLPLATLSSITEPIIMMSRLDAQDIPYAAKELSKALSLQTVRTIDNTIKTMRRTLGQEVKSNSNIKFLNDDEWQELYETGLGLEASVMERIDGMYGEAFQGTTAKGFQNFFFKSTLLTQWTQAVQLASFNTGKRLIQTNARKLSDNASGKKIISRKIQRYYEEQLEDLGLNVKQTLTWYKDSLKNKKFDRNKSNIQDFYKENIQNAANRFTKEIILNPSTSAANRPLWFSNPSVNYLVQFAGYPTAFNNTIMKRFVNESINYRTKVIPKVLATSMLMTSVALLGNYIRTVGVSGNQERWDSQTDAQKISEAYRRWGGFAAFDYAMRFETEKERGSGLPTALFKGVVGPIGQDFIDAIAYRKGFTGIAASNLPYSAWLSNDVKKKLKAGARKIDKSIDDNTLNLFADEPELKKSKRKRKRSPYAKGMGVSKDVPNVKDEPENAINPLTGQPYAVGSVLTEASLQRENQQDQMARLGFADGDEVNLKNNSTPLTFNQQYHRDTITNKEAFQDINGNVVTANVIGVEYKGKIYNLPSYDRHGGYFSDEELKKKYEVEMETGIIKGYNKEFDGAIVDHPANVAARNEHNLMQKETELAREAVKYKETPSKQIGRGFKAGMKALGLSEGGKI